MPDGVVEMSVNFTCEICGEDFDICCVRFQYSDSDGDTIKSICNTCYPDFFQYLVDLYKATL